MIFSFDVHRNNIFFLIMISTPLILACEIGNVEISELLLQNGAIIDMRGHKGR